MSNEELIEIFRELERINIYINQILKVLKLKWKKLFPERAFQNITIKLK